MFFQGCLSASSSTVLKNKYRYIVRYIYFLFFQLIFSRYYSGSSASDKTSLFALRNLVNWRDVVSDAQHNSAPCKRFVNMVLDADIIAAALKFFGRTSSDDKPTKHSFDSDFMRISLRAVSLKYFNRIVQEFIQTFVVDGSLYENHFVNIQALQEWETAKQNQPLLPNSRYPCRFPGVHVHSTRRGSQGETRTFS